MHGFADSRTCREMPIVIALAAVAMIACAGPAIAQQAATTAPATRERAGVLVPGERIAIEALLAELAEKTGIIVVKTDSIPGEVVVTQELPADPQKAIDAVNEMLAPAGYRGVPAVGTGANENASRTHRIVLRVQSKSEARAVELQTGPVSYGTDPRKIDISDRNRMVTHIAPVTNPDLLNNAKRAAGNEADVAVTVTGTPETGMQLVFTGPALSVRHALESAMAADPPPQTTQIVRSVRLKNLEAEGSANTVNDTYGYDASGKQVLHAVADKRTNSLILSGTDLAVLQALQMLQRLDAAAPSGQQNLPDVVPPERVPPPPAQPPIPAIPHGTTQPRSPSARLDGIAPVADNI